MAARMSEMLAVSRLKVLARVRVALAKRAREQARRRTASGRMGSEGRGGSGEKDRAVEAVRLPRTPARSARARGFHRGQKLRVSVMSKLRGRRAATELNEPPLK